MSIFSARYARKVQYCDNARRARRKNCNFSYFCPTNPKHGSTPLSQYGKFKVRSHMSGFAAAVSRSTLPPRFAAAVCCSYMSGFPRGIM